MTTTTAAVSAVIDLAERIAAEYPAEPARLRAIRSRRALISTDPAQALWSAVTDLEGVWPGLDLLAEASGDHPALCRDLRAAVRAVAPSLGICWSDLLDGAHLPPGLACGPEYVCVVCGERAAVPEGDCDEDPCG